MRVCTFVKNTLNLIVYKFSKPLNLLYFLIFYKFIYCQTNRWEHLCTVWLVTKFLFSMTFKPFLSRSVSNFGILRICKQFAYVFTYKHRNSLKLLIFFVIHLLSSICIALSLFYYQTLQILSCMALNTAAWLIPRILSKYNAICDVLKLEFLNYTLWAGKDK